MPHPTSARRRRAGFVLVTMMLAMVGLLAFLGLAIDVGYMQYQKTCMQAAADAAALGGVQELRMNGSASVAAAAKSDAALNGFTGGQNGVSVTVNSPPASGYYTGDSTAVEVLISQTVKTLFLALAGSSSATVQARAVAHQGPGTGCIFALDASAAGAFSVSNGATVQASGCGVVVDSTSAQALTVTGGAKASAASFSVAGSYSITNGGSANPLPTAHAAAQPDPLAYVAAPSVGSGCLQTNYNPGWTPPPLVLNPGIYCGGIRLGNGNTVIFNPGTYILKGGGLSIGGGVNASGTGVTFYNTQGGGFNFQPIALDNGTTINFSAPTTGPLAAMLFFQDRGISAATGISLAGGANLTLNGALYFPGSAFSCSNGASCATGAYTIIVAKTLSFTGGVNVKADYSSLPGGTPVKGGAALSE